MDIDKLIELIKEVEEFRQVKKSENRTLEKLLEILNGPVVTKF